MGRIYLDNAATSWPKPETVYAAVDRYMRECGAPLSYAYVPMLLRRRRAAAATSTADTSGRVNAVIIARVARSEPPAAGLQ